MNKHEARSIVITSSITVKSAGPAAIRHRPAAFSHATDKHITAESNILYQLATLRPLELERSKLLGAAPEVNASVFRAADNQPPDR